MSTLLQVQSRMPLGLRANPNCFRRAGDPGIQMWDTTVDMFNGFPFKCAFAFNIFCFLPVKNVLLKTSFPSSFSQVFSCFHFLHFLSSISIPLWFSRTSRGRCH